MGAQLEEKRFLEFQIGLETEYVIGIVIDCCRGRSSWAARAAD
jgi:hypothetical protein